MIEIIEHKEKGNFILTYKHYTTGWCYTRTHWIYETENIRLSIDRHYYKREKCVTYSFRESYWNKNNRIIGETILLRIGLTKKEFKEIMKIKYGIFFK